jgi:hypothetical protein
MTFEVFRTVEIQIEVFWLVTPCSDVRRLFAKFVDWRQCASVM